MEDYQNSTDCYITISAAVADTPNNKIAIYENKSSQGLSRM